MKLLSIIVFFTLIPVFALAGATGKCYYDKRTGHKYIRTNGDYDEYTKAGLFFKKVDPDLPLLNHSESVILLTDGHYIKYKQCIDGEYYYKTLPALKEHPEGWKADKLLDP